MRTLLRSLAANSAIEDLPAKRRMRIAESLTRSEQVYGLQRSHKPPESPLSNAEILELKDQVEMFLRIATPGVDWLHQQIGGLGCCTLLTNAAGVALELKTNNRFVEDFKKQGLRLGVCWSEEEHGTCGVGTALADGTSILVKEGEHFLIQNHGITCGAVPIFSPDKKILGILNTTALSSYTDARSIAAAYNLTLQTAKKIEHTYFSEIFSDAWIMQLYTHPNRWGVDDGIRIAFNDSGRILGMCRKLKQGLATEKIDFSLEMSNLFDVSVNKLIDQALSNIGNPVELYANPNGSLPLFAYFRSPKLRRASSLNKPVSKSSPKNENFGNLAIGDPALLETISRIKRLVNCKIPILLLGETGSGKESFAKAIHEFSNRKNKNFVAINCAAIPGSLIESELFGYKEGAFTGAKAKGSQGKISLANGGTLFLDEIGDMPLALQTRLLRVLAEGEVLALGATSPERVDISVICATHRNLQEMVKEKTFREDLFYRLNAATFKLPALRERKDILDVVYVIFREEAGNKDQHLKISPNLEKLLCDYSWPGNIRELRNVLRFSIAMSSDGQVDIEHLPEYLRTLPSPENNCVHNIERVDFQLLSNNCERADLIGALRTSGWNASVACKFLGISRSTLYRKMRQNAIVSPNMMDTAYKI